jgi:hypothetical protein
MLEDAEKKLEVLYDQMCTQQVSALIIQELNRICEGPSYLCSIRSIRLWLRP